MGEVKPKRERQRMLAYAVSGRSGLHFFLRLALMIVGFLLRR
jgi:hypothetical protein